MILIFHKISGVIIIIVYSYIFTNMGDYYPGLKAAWEVDYGRRTVVGAGFVTLLPFVASALFIFPRYFSEKFSLKTGFFPEAVFGPCSFIFLGYLLLIFDIALLQLFK